MSSHAVATLTSPKKKEHVMPSGKTQITDCTFKILSFSANEYNTFMISALIIPYTKEAIQQPRFVNWLFSDLNNMLSELHYLVQKFTPNGKFEELLHQHIEAKLETRNDYFKDYYRFVALHPAVESEESTWPRQGAEGHFITFSK